MKEMIGALQQHPGQLRQDQNDGFAKLIRERIGKHEGRVKGVSGSCTQRTDQVRMFIGQVKIHNDSAGVFRKYDMKLILGFRREVDNGVVGDTMCFPVDHDTTGDVLKEKQSAIIANVGRSPNAQSVLVYSSIPDMGIQIR